MLRKSVVIMALLLSSLATQVFALGLGTVTVESALNQPLRVRIEILQLGDTRLQDVSVQMASLDDFQRFNIERVGFLSNIRFAVNAGPGGNFVTLTSNQIVREPYLSFILDTRWPNGRLLSEHTILLDLPVFDNQRQGSTVRQPISPVLQPPSSQAQPRTVTPAAPAPAVAAPVVDIAPAATEDVTPTPPPSQEVTELEPVSEPAQLAEPEPVAEPEQLAEPEPVIEPEQVADPVLTPAAPTPVDTTVTPDSADAEPETIATTAEDTLSDIALQVRPSGAVSMQQTMLAIQRLNPDAFIDGNINRMRSGQVLRVPDLTEIQNVDAREAAAEVARQNQEFATADVQPLAAPATQTPAQVAAPQGQLSVVTSDADAIDASSGAGQLDSVENEVLDQRIAELENQLAVQQEEADRARIQREELDARMDELEQQIAAAQEIIRLQDIQLAQLQDSLAQAAAEQAVQLAAIADAEAQAAEQAAGRTSFVDDVMRIITGNILFVGFGLVLVILLLVVLLLRRNRAKLDDSDLNELDSEDFTRRESGEGDSEEKFQDFDAGDLDNELDEIIGADDDGDPLAEARAMLRKGNVTGAIKLLQRAIAEEPEDQELRLKLLEAFAQQGDLSAFEEQADLLNNEPDINDRITALRDSIKISEPEPVAAPAKTAKRASTDEEDRLGAASFLDDLGIDLDAFDDDEDEEPAVAERESKAAEPPPVAKKPAAPSLDDDSFLADDMDLTFDLAGDDEDAPASAEIDVAEAEEVNIDSAADAISVDDSAHTDLEFDVEAAPAADDEGSSKETEELDIEAFEFEVDESPAAPATSAEEPAIELETFAFDTDDLDLSKSTEPEPEKPAADADNLMDFDFDKTEIEVAPNVADTSDDDLETFEFDIDENPDATVVEKPEDDDADLQVIDTDDFDLDAADTSASNEAPDSADDEDDYLDLDAMDAGKVSETPADTDIEFDLDEDAAEAEATPAAAEISAEEDELDDLEFLSDDDEIEIESVDDVEEVGPLSDADEVATKLELAYAYRKMGDVEGAREILQEVINEGSNEQVKEAKDLMSSLDDND